jgi:pSer/pThr/pTyr-binding forkhead associated (FHA) protein
MQVALFMFGADGERRRFQLSRDMTVIGRREDCDLRIPLGDVSRKHCRLVKDDAGVRIEDLGSSNGTYRNGERVQEATLEPGDNIKVGPVFFVVQIDGAPVEEEITQPHVATPTEAAESAAEIEALEEAPLEEASLEEDAGEPAEAAPAGDGDEFDPMSALGGSDSGLDLDGPLPGDSMQADMESEK